MSYSCANCDYVSTTKLGKCPSCGDFGSFILTNKYHKDNKGSKHSIQEGNILSSQSIQQSQIIYWKIDNRELQRVFGDGIKRGGMYLLGGSPGIGKSTLILQIIQEVLNNNINVGYFTGEEQETQVLDRYSRITQNKSDLQKDNNSFSVFHATHLEDIIATILDKKFEFVVIDSIQTIYADKIESTAGSPNQVKYCAEKLSEFGKKNNCTLFIVGHITKDGEIAGPKYLEHIVDVVLYLEGDKFGQLRFLRSKKNRFGHTDDSGIFEMTLFGLQPVYDLRERILKSANTSIPGSVICIGLDNGRPVITHLEVLLNKTKYKFPQKSCIGVSSKRLDLIVAILEKYMRMDFSLFDIYVNVPGEFSFLDSGLDLSIAVALFGQYYNKPTIQNSIFIGELGLGGQIVKTKLHDKRKNEIPQGFEMFDFEKIKHIIELKNVLI